jgi:hypothetical protein
MKQMTVMEKYPIFTIEIDKSETTFDTVDKILTHLKDKIDTHPVATYIGDFDHYAHTKSLEDGEIADDITDAKNIICCFGKQLPKATLLAVRPRAIGVAKMNNGSFVISFLEAPNPQANNAMESWVKSIANI